MNRRNVGISVTIACVAALYQLALASEPLNDHFVHVVLGREMLAGRWPVRDVFEPGAPLMTALSALAELALGYRLLAAGAVAAAAIGISAWCVYAVTWRLTKAAWCSGLAGVLVVLAGTRSYSYPKVLVYAVAALLICRYFERSSLARLAQLAAWSAVACLLRHDHGAYVAFGTGLTLVLAHGATADTVKRGLLAAAVTLGLAGPYFLWVERYAGIGPYLAQSLALTRSEIEENGGSILAWPLRRFGDLIAIDAQSTFAPTIGIRWQPSSTPSEREIALSRYGLVRLDSSTGSLEDRARLERPDSANIRAMVLDPSIEDTANIDRSASEVSPERWRIWTRWRFEYPVLRIRFLPAFDDVEQAAQVLSLLWVVLPAAAGLWGMRLLLKARAEGQPDPRVVVVLSGLSMVVAVGLLRRPLEVYVPDIVALASTLTLYVVAVLWGFEFPRMSSRRLVPRTIAVVLLALMLFSVNRVGMLGSRASWLSGAWHPVDQARATWSEIGWRLAASPPMRFWTDRPGSAQVELARYVDACTSPNAPLLVLAFAPEIYYYADRRVASYQIVLGPLTMWSPPDAGGRTLRAIAQSPPPLVIADRAILNGAFPERYPELAAYVAAHYEIQGELAEEDRRFDILAVRSRPPVGTYGNRGWPCF